MKATVVTALLALLAAVARADDVTSCVPNSLGLLGSRYVLLARYDASSGNNADAINGQPGDPDGILDFGSFVVSNATAAQQLCDGQGRVGGQRQCQAFLYARRTTEDPPFSYTWLKRGACATNDCAVGDIMRLLNSPNIGPIGPTFMPTDCFGLYVSTEGLDANSISCLYNNQGSPKALLACLKCGFAPEFAGKRAECRSCVDNLRGVDYANVEQCYACRSAPLGLNRCRDCLTNLATSANPAWSTNCPTISTDTQFKCVMNNKANATFNVAQCFA